jgi:molybdopterin-guanine dinucleotide biosynthesis protein B
MKVIGLAGWSGAGKTTLLKRAIPHLLKEGLPRLRHQARPSRIRRRRARQGFLGAPPVRRVGGAGVLEPALGADALNCAARPSRGLQELLAKMAPVDLVLVEGFKREPHRKIEVHRATNGKPWLFPDDPGIVGIVHRRQGSRQGCRSFHLDDVDAVAALIKDIAIIDRGSVFEATA